MKKNNAGAAQREHPPNHEFSDLRGVGVRRTPLTKHAVSFMPSYQFTPGASRNNAFCWLTGEPSIFADDKAFRANDKGESRSQTATRTVIEYELTHGKSRGTVMGISAVADRQSEEFTHRIRSGAGKHRKAA